MCIYIRNLMLCFFSYYSRGDGFCTTVFLEMRVHRITIWRSDGSEDCALLFKITNSKWYIVFASDLGVLDWLHSAFVQSQISSVITSIFSNSWYYSTSALSQFCITSHIELWIIILLKMVLPLSVLILCRFGS